MNHRKNGFLCIWKTKKRIFTLSPRTNSINLKIGYFSWWCRYHCHSWNSCMYINSKWFFPVDYSLFTIFFLYFCMIILYCISFSQSKILVDWFKYTTFLYAGFFGNLTYSILIYFCSNAFQWYKVEILKICCIS